MPYVVRFEYSGVMKVVKTSWCERLKCADLKNKGFRVSTFVKVFYSKDTTQQPDFELETKETFDEGTPACYYGFVLRICGEKSVELLICNMCTFQQFLMLHFLLCFVDTKEEARLYLSRKRRLSPVNYDESDEKRKYRQSNGNQSAAALVKEKIRIECEHISRLKSAIGALNRQHDRREVLDVCESDCEEIDDLITAPDQQNEEVPTSMDECKRVPSKFAEDGDSDDSLIFIASSTLHSSIIRTGIIPLEVDNEFSLEYTYTTDVRSSK